MYVCLTGKYPFDGKSRDEVFAKIQAGVFDQSQKTFRNVSEDCIDLLRNMLVVDRKKRIKTKAVLKHRWFEQLKNKDNNGSENIDNEVVESLKKFKGSSILKKAALNVLVKMLKP